MRVLEEEVALHFLEEEERWVMGSVWVGRSRSPVLMGTRLLTVRMGRSELHPVPLRQSEKAQHPYIAHGPV
jgi:hypothetical protein